MPRVARIVVPGWPHHITQRGNNKQDVFFVDQDRRVYLKLLAEHTRKHGVAILGYCLMGNHTHLVGVPEHENSLAKAIGQTHLRYSQYINRMHGRSGHLWQNRFYSAAFEWEDLPGVLRYAERNPLRAHMCRSPWTYRWSSAGFHCGMGADTFGLLDAKRWEQLREDMDWRATLQDPDDPAQMRLIRERTHTGRPLVSDSMLSKLEVMLGRRLRVLPVGRPRRRRNR